MNYEYNIRLIVVRRDVVKVNVSRREMQGAYVNQNSSFCFLYLP